HARLARAEVAAERIDEGQDRGAAPQRRKGELPAMLVPESERRRVAGAGGPGLGHLGRRAGLARARDFSDDQREAEAKKRGPDPDQPPVAVHASMMREEPVSDTVYVSDTALRGGRAPTA